MTHAPSIGNNYRNSIYFTRCTASGDTVSSDGSSNAQAQLTANCGVSSALRHRMTEDTAQAQERGHRAVRCRPAHCELRCQRCPASPHDGRYRASARARTPCCWSSHPSPCARLTRRSWHATWRGRSCRSTCRTCTREASSRSLPTPRASSCKSSAPPSVWPAGTPPPSSSASAG